MGRIFPPWSNTFARVSILAVIFGLAGFAWVAGIIDRSSWIKDTEVPLNQPVQFSHQHHVGDLGLDCRYCHTTVEVSPFANLPSTEICMTCHSQIWTQSPMLEPVRVSWRDNTPIQWNRVNDLPDYVYFNHDIHVQKGVGCVSCHGAVDTMALTWKPQPFNMSWCLDCHRAPENYLRPVDQVFNLHWQPQEDQVALGRRLVEDYHILGPDVLTSCSTCHR